MNIVFNMHGAHDAEHMYKQACEPNVYVTFHSQLGRQRKTNKLGRQKTKRKSLEDSCSFLCRPISNTTIQHIINVAFAFIAHTHTHTHTHGTCIHKCIFMGLRPPAAGPPFLDPGTPLAGDRRAAAGL